MKTRLTKIAIIVFLAAAVVAGCSSSGVVKAPLPLPSDTPVPGADLIRTQAVGTALAALTEQAAVEKAAQAATSTYIITHVPQNTTAATEKPTRTPTILLPTATVTPAQSNYQCRLLVVHPEPDSHFPAEYHFDGYIQVKNTGSETWKPGEVFFIYTGGDVTGGSKAAALTQEIDPGKKVEFSVDLIAPHTPDHYESHWAVMVDLDQDIYFCPVTFEFSVEK
jgi:hypothetical protein